MAVKVKKPALLGHGAKRLPFRERVPGVNNSIVKDVVVVAETPKPRSHAVENLINRDDYISVVNDFLERMGQSKRFDATEVAAETPVAKAFADWAKANRLQAPSKVEVAYALLAKSGRRLTLDGKRALVALHSNS